MSRFLNSEFVERLFFSAIVLGILLTLFGGIRFFMLSNQITSNEAAQIHLSGEEVAVETMNEAQGLVASDLERRRLVNERYNMMIAAGIGLTLVGIGWIAGDVMRSRRKKEDEAPVPPVAEATS